MAAAAPAKVLVAWGLRAVDARPLVKKQMKAVAVADSAALLSLATVAREGKGAVVAKMDVRILNALDANY